MEISVIVPIYNAEKYLQRCIDSIRNQDYKDLEILLIDDGSTDHSAEICMENKKNDDRIHVISQQNAGQSGARNKGMEAASGEYVCFVDADDKLIKNAIKRMAEEASDGAYDIVAGGYYRLENNNPKNRTKVTPEEGICARNGTVEEQKRYHRYKTTSAAGYVWAKLYKAEFLKQNSLQFDDIRKVFMEDTMFNTKAFSYLPKYYLISEPVYCYYIYENSFSHGKEENVSMKYIHMMEELDCFFKKKGNMEENIDLVAPLAGRTFCWSVIKNIPYTGLSYRGIDREITCFAKADYMKRLVKHKASYKALKLLSSPLERLFYGFCFLMLRLHLGKVLALIFTITYPLQKVYIGKNLS